MPRSFGKYRDLPTVDESYAAGFRTGKEWEWNDTPGGPWVCHAGYSTDKDWIARCEASAENNAAYMRGWREGRAYKNK